MSMQTETTAAAADSPVARGAWQVLKFGKHKGKTLPQVLLTDPDWFFWAVGEDAFHSDELVAEAERLRQLATHIKIPNDPEKSSVVEYALQYGEPKALAYVKPVEASAPIDGPRKFREPYFDLSWPSSQKMYGKRSAQVLIRAIKRYVMRDENALLTRRRCEKFFEDPSNFEALPQAQANIVG